MAPVASAPPTSVNLPTERLVLAFGCGIAAAAYVYWTVEAVRLGIGWASVASLRAGVVLGATVLLALVLRAAFRTNRQVGADRPPDP